MKGVALVLLVLIVGSLAKALASMTAGTSVEHARAVVRALTVRVTLSLGLFALLLAGAHFGWITPH